MTISKRAATFIACALSVASGGFAAAGADESCGITIPALGLAAGPDESCDVLVTACGDDTQDPSNLRTALHGPFANDTVTVCIAGTFELGGATVPVQPTPMNPGTTMAALTLVGLDGPNGKATLHEGFNSLIVPSLLTPDGPTNDVHSIRFRNFRIEDATSAAINVFRVNDYLEISDVDIEDVSSAHIVVVPGVLEFNARIGINLSSFYASPYNTINGLVEIRNCHVDAGPYSADNPLDSSIIAPAGIGVFGFDIQPISADVVVENNTVTGWSGSGIGVTYTAHAEVRDNDIETGAFANDVEQLAAGLSECATFNGLATAGGVSVSGPGDVSVVDNSIDMGVARTADNVPAKCAAGVLLARADGALVQDNQVRGGGAANVRGLVVVDSANSLLQDDGVRDAGIGFSVDTSADITFADISIHDTPVCYLADGFDDIGDDTVSQDIRLEDVTCGHGGDLHSARRR